MDKPSPDRTELFLRYVRRTLYLCLGVVTLGALYLILTIWDREGRLERLRVGLLVLCPVALATGAAWLQGTLKGNRYSLKDADVRAILQDELRRQSFDRAFRVAFGTVMALQMPLAWLLFQNPGEQSLIHMGTFTILIGFIALVSAFLFFDRD